MGPGEGADLSKAKAGRNIAFLSLLLPAWETCSPSIKAPDLLVTGARPTHESNWTPMVKVLPRFRQKYCSGPGPDAGRGSQDRCCLTHHIERHYPVNPHAYQARMSWAPLFLSMVKGSVKSTPMALQASGILTRLRALGAGISWVTTVQL